MFFWNSLAFSMIHQMLTIWSLVPLPFLNPACTSESSQFTYCWSLAWRILSMTLLAYSSALLVAQLVKNCLQCGRPGFEPWAGKIPWRRSVLIPIPKKGNVKECSNYQIIALISHASKVVLKILQARLQQYVNWELPDVQVGCRIGRGTRNQTANIR